MKRMGFPLSSPVLVQMGAQERRSGRHVDEARGRRVNMPLSVLAKRDPVVSAEERMRRSGLDGAESHLHLGRK